MIIKTTEDIEKLLKRAENLNQVKVNPIYDDEFEQIEFFPEIVIEEKTQIDVFIENEHFKADWDAVRIKKFVSHHPFEKRAFFIDFDKKIVTDFSISYEITDARTGKGIGIIYDVIDGKIKINKFYLF